MGEQCVCRFGCQVDRSEAVDVPEVVEKSAREQQNVLAAFAQRRNPDLEHVDPIVQIFTKRATRHRIVQVSIRRDNHPHIRFERFCAAKPPEFTLL
jgi:hypothetical protein